MALSAAFQPEWLVQVQRPSFLELDARGNIYTSELVSGGNAPFQQILRSLRPDGVERWAMTATNSATPCPGCALGVSSEGHIGFVLSPTTSAPINFNGVELPMSPVIVCPRSQVATGLDRVGSCSLGSHHDSGPQVRRPSERITVQNAAVRREGNKIRFGSSGAQHDPRCIRKPFAGKHRGPGTKLFAGAASGRRGLPASTHTGLAQRWARTTVLAGSAQPLQLPLSPLFLFSLADRKSRELALTHRDMNGRPVVSHNHARARRSVAVTARPHGCSERNPRQDSSWNSSDSTRHSVQPRARSRHGVPTVPRSDDSPRRSQRRTASQWDNPFGRHLTFFPSRQCGFAASIRPALLTVLSAQSNISEQCRSGETRNGLQQEMELPLAVAPRQRRSKIVHIARSSRTASARALANHPVHVVAARRRDVGSLAAPLLAPSASHRSGVAASQFRLVPSASRTYPSLVDRRRGKLRASAAFRSLPRDINGRSRAIAATAKRPRVIDRFHP